MSYEPVIGLEVHTQLQTESKLFCGCSTQFGAAPNTHTCPVCLGLPGALPVLNRRAVELAVKAALALGCTVHERSIFARKNYFYPDLPKGYQISQYDRPLATEGVLEFEARGDARRVGIIRVHLEEDAGKSLHEGLPDSDRASALDFNRSGVPLIEIVSHPDVRNAADAAECFTRLRAILVATGVTDGNMEEGSLRCDANVSVRRAGAQAFGVKTEIKNLNSFRHVQRALEYEIDRQIACSKAAAGSSTRRGCGIRRRHGRCRCGARKTRTITATFPNPISRRCKSNGAGSTVSGRACPNCRMRGGAGSSRRTPCPRTMRPFSRNQRHGGLLRGRGGGVRESQGRRQLDHG